MLEESAEAPGLKVCRAQLAGKLILIKEIHQNQTPLTPFRGSGGVGNLCAVFYYSPTLLSIIHKFVLFRLGLLLAAGRRRSHLLESTSPNSFAPARVVLGVGSASRFDENGP